MFCMYRLNRTSTIKNRTPYLLQRWNCQLSNRLFAFLLKNAMNLYMGIQVLSYSQMVIFVELFSFLILCSWSQLSPSPIPVVPWKAGTAPGHMTELKNIVYLPMVFVQVFTSSYIPDISCKGINICFIPSHLITCE